LGNTCFSFFTQIFTEFAPLDAKDVILIKIFLILKVNNFIILESLKKFDINAELSGRNDIVFNQRKISGSAY